MIMPPNILIEAQNAEVFYGKSKALSIPSLKSLGNVTALIGHNGAGKSTFIKAVLGILNLKSGNLLVQEHNPESLQLRADQHMAFCPENGSVFSDISVAEYLEFWCRLKHRQKDYYLKQGEHYIEALSIGNLLKRLGRELSKGQRRRVQAAIGFIIKPRLFLFDEPFDGLDVQQTAELVELIQEERRNMGFLVSSHRMDVIEQLADQVVVLENGGIHQTGSPSEVAQALGAGNNESLSEAMHHYLKSVRNSQLIQ